MKFYKSFNTDGKDKPILKPDFLSDIHIGNIMIDTIEKLDDDRIWKLSTKLKDNLTKMKPLKKPFKSVSKPLLLNEKEQTKTISLARSSSGENYDVIGLPRVTSEARINNRWSRFKSIFYRQDNIYNDSLSGEKATHTPIPRSKTEKHVEKSTAEPKGIIRQYDTNAIDDSTNFKRDYIN
ncbi:hypothetical protein L3V82_08850 [Thiotrichales bacterium 19S3-7]|nr:hypothetical protein [Thiotrichales bacterium 19S3-7]